MLLRKGFALPQEIAHGIGILLEIDLKRLPSDGRDGIRISLIEEHGWRVAEIAHVAGRPIPEENVDRKRGVVAKRAVYIPTNPARSEHLEIRSEVVPPYCCLRHADEKF